MHVRKLVDPIVMPVMRYATRRYITGDKLEDGLSLARDVARAGLSCTMCFWQDPKDGPETVAEEYEAIITRLRDEGLDGALAMKLPALWEREPPTDRVIALARQTGTQVIFDSHDPHKTDDTRAAIDRIGSDHVGMAIPGRWLRSDDDAEFAIERGLRIRVVKGQWPDPEDPSIDLREGYLRIIDRIAGRAAFVGVATHDAPLAAKAMKILADAGTPFEQEFVYPLPIDDALKEGAKYGVGARLYIPYGAAWLPYSVKRAIKDPKVLYYLAKDMVQGRRFKCPDPRPGMSPAEQAL